MISNLYPGYPGKIFPDDRPRGISGYKARFRIHITEKYMYMILIKYFLGGPLQILSRPQYLQAGRKVWALGDDQAGSVPNKKRGDGPVLMGVSDGVGKQLGGRQHLDFG